MTPLQEWVVRLAREAATVEIVACHYAPGTHHHGDLIGITSEGATLPFCGCKSAKQVEAEQQDRRIRYAGNSITKPNTTELNEIQTRTNRLAFKRQLLGLATNQEAHLLQREPSSMGVGSDRRRF